jgi:ferric-dicitrate binding protein FerR (iron transport regulator)
MNRDELIKKWLDDELTTQEFEMFKSLEDYEQLIKLSDSLKQFKAPEYNVSEELTKLLPKTKKTASNSWLNPILKVAAVIAICFSVYYYTTNLNTTVNTLASEKTTIELPDNSEVKLNALSSLSFNKKNWKNERVITLNGEAYFKVEKGEHFNVKTPSGIITVLGTQFNVKQRNNLFEVVCYEGSVKVTHKLDTKILKTGDSFLILDGKYIAKEKENTKNPSWINNESYFKSIPYYYVIKEFERQYNTSISAKNIDLKQLFTGSFSHNNKELALKSITLPLNINYTIKNSSIVLVRE